MKAHRVEENVMELLGKILSRDAAELSLSFALTRANRVEPIDIARLAMACERAFGLALYDEKVAQWRTVADVCGHIAALLEEGLATALPEDDEGRVNWYYA